MTIEPFLISLPTADRHRSSVFYSEGLGLVTVGEPADDGLPEPLVFVVNDTTRLMLVPTGGFGWVIGGNEAAPAGTSECVLGVTADSGADVRAVVGRARAAGGTVVSEPATEPWGYASLVADPDGHLWMVTSGDAD